MFVFVPLAERLLGHVRGENLWDVFSWSTTINGDGLSALHAIQAKW